MEHADPSVAVGEPLRHASLSVFPLFRRAGRAARYRLASDGLAQGTVEVLEVGDEGIVGEVEVQNHGDVPALLLEGEELVGAKQDRVVNTTVLVPAHGSLRVPVSCVEQGRWAYRSRHMMDSGVHSPSAVRYALKSSVTLGLQENQRPVSNQVEVWESVARLHAGHDVASHSQAMGDTYTARAAEVAAFREALRYVDGAHGLAVSVGDRILALDLFDRPDTCEKVWDRLLSGAVLDALLSPTESPSVAKTSVASLLRDLEEAVWEPVATLGEGQECRVELGSVCASTLTVEGVVVHESAVLG